MTRKYVLTPILLGAVAVIAVCLLAGSASAQTPAKVSSSEPQCKSTVKADIVALDQVVLVNRLGAVRPGGMIFALRRDVVSSQAGTGLTQGNVQLREGKRPRPIVLRVNKGDCLNIAFENLLKSSNFDPIQPATRSASIHISGMELRSDITDDGTNVGANASGLVAPGAKATYQLYAKDVGTYLIYSTAGDYNGFGTEQLTMGLFGAVTVEPESSEYYRSQVTNEDLKVVTTGRTKDGQPIISNYGALYPADYDTKHPSDQTRACTPVLKMVDIPHQPASGGVCVPCAKKGKECIPCKLDSNGKCRTDSGEEAIEETYHTDLTAIITGRNAGEFKAGSDPVFSPNPAYPKRTQPFREFTIHYHESQDVVQAFPWAYNPLNSRTPTINSGSDSFAINYGTAGIGPEILANRFGVGPTRDCPECKFEEFFLSSWAGGDPAMIVDVPANAPCTQPANQQFLLEQAAIASSPIAPPCTPSPVVRATKAFFPDDPSNVYHSYLGDHVKFQILHAGAAVHHVHHHHAHQWLHSPNSDESEYLDSQAIGPGSSFTLDLVYNGSGNRNLTVGDSIFHCHFYPHFAAGMWSLHRVHDVFEAGTELDSSGRPAPGSRALPDPEITTGTPIPAVVPLPTIAMAPAPATVRIFNGRMESVGDGNPGYPFFIPGIVGHRPPHPPLDFAPDLDERNNQKKDSKGNPMYLNGGLPRHLILSANVTNEQHTPLDFSKDIDTITAVELPEEGTDLEIRAMKYHGTRQHPSFRPDGKPAIFITNGLPQKSQRGAPYADPAINDDGTAVCPNRDPKCFHVYKGANIQIDTVFNKAGWHYPQQRMITLWGDVNAFVSGAKPPEPLLFRANSGSVVEYWHTNLVPDYYELDDFQVRTPTDILGQHIHLVKFDVLASDGAANGFNYEDGTFSPDEVRKRIAGINAAGGLWSHDKKGQRALTAKGIPYFDNAPAPYKKYWLGAQATVQRWYVDPLLDNKRFDRTITTVFTHDHFGPSTHQMIGLYGGLLVEPRDSKWTFLNGTEMGNRVLPFGGGTDGGPTSYAANIITGSEGSDSYREFALMWQDLQLLYQPTSKSKPDCYINQSSKDTNCVDLVEGAQYQGWADPANVINCPSCVVGASGSISGGLNGFPSQEDTVNCPGCGPTTSFSILGQNQVSQLPSQQGSSFVSAGAFGMAPSPPLPLLISDFGAGAFSMNYRTEPLPLRVAMPPNPKAFNQAAGKYASDLSHVFRSIDRLDTTFSAQPLGGGVINKSCQGPDCFKFPQLPISDGMLPQDPYTPLLRAYENDKVQIRVLAGAHTSMHNFSMHGIKWLFEPHVKNSGYRNSQLVLLSEHFEMHFTLPPSDANNNCAPPGSTMKIPCADYLYNPSSSYEGLVNGTWGLFRAYNGSKGLLADLKPLPNNPNGSAPGSQASRFEIPPTARDCPKKMDLGKPAEPCVRNFTVYAMTVSQARGTGNPLIYNSRGAFTGTDSNGNNQFDSKNPLEDPNALLYVSDEDVDLSRDAKRGFLKEEVNTEPLVLRAAAGDWIKVTLVNLLDPQDPLFSIRESAAKPSGTAPYTNPFVSVRLSASTNVGLHPQLLAYDISKSDGGNVGLNPVQTVDPDDTANAACPQNSNKKYPCKQYVWYAGDLKPKSDGGMQQTPIEFGAINLLPSDPLVHPYRGLFGALVVEPVGSTWKEDTDYNASATVFTKEGSVFRDFVLIVQDDVGMKLNGHSMYESGNNLSAFNYRTEPFFFRFGARMYPTPNTGPADWSNLTASDLATISPFQFSSIDTSQSTSNVLVSGEAQTPIFRAPAGMPVRYRVLAAGGIGDNQQVFELTGHVWQEEPYTKDSTEMGDNPLSQSTGTTPAWGPTSHYNVLVNAGGRYKVPGDYLYRSWTANQFQVGTWGVFRVSPAVTDADCSAKDRNYPNTVTISNVQANANGFTVSGVNTIYPCLLPAYDFGQEVNVSYGGKTVAVKVNQENGRWTHTDGGGIPAQITATSLYRDKQGKTLAGGSAVYINYQKAAVATNSTAPAKEVLRTKKRKTHSSRP